MTSSGAHIYFSPMEHESRLMRAVETGLSSGLFDCIDIIGYREGSLPQKERLNTATTVHRLEVHPSLPLLPRLVNRSLGWLIWTVKTGLFLRRARPQFVQAHSLASLPAAVIAKLGTSITLLYDAHELETERIGWGKMQKTVARVLERLLISQADRIVVVSKSIAEWYAVNYGIPAPAVVHNMPRRSTLSKGAPIAQPKSLRDALGLAKSDILYVYLGAIGEGRGIEMVLEAFKQLPPQLHFCAVGYGDLAQKVIDASFNHANIHFHPPVSSEQVIAFIRDADIGLSIIEDLCLSYRYCLPNKLFETRLAGLPVLASDLPEMKRFITEYGGGWVVKPNTESIAKLIRIIDHAKIDAVTQNAADVPTWEDEEECYVQCVRDAIAAGRTRN